MNSTGSWKACLLLLLTIQAAVGTLLSRLADPVADYGRTLRLRARKRMQELEL